MEKEGKKNKNNQQNYVMMCAREKQNVSFGSDNEKNLIAVNDNIFI